jgi:Beta-ketoacyl synthase, N-terminal domain
MVRLGVVVICRALVAGVNLTMRAETTAVLAKAGMLTQDGRCKTLDSSADGYARGEACVVRLCGILGEIAFSRLCMSSLQRVSGYYANGHIVTCG